MSHLVVRTHPDVSFDYYFEPFFHFLNRLFFIFFRFFFRCRDHLRNSSENIAFLSQKLNFKARFWVREERRKKKEERKKKNAPTETGSLPQAHAQELFVSRVRGNSSLRPTVAEWNPRHSKTG